MEIYVAEPIITSILITMATLFMSPFDDARGGWGESDWPQSVNQYVIICLPISPSKQSEQSGALLKVLSTGRVSLHHGLSGISQKKGM